MEGEQSWRGAQTCFGDVSVTTLVTMFKKVKFEGRDSIGWENLDLPEIKLDTMGCWLIPPRDVLRLCRTHGRVPTEGLKGIANVMAEVAPLFAMCDPSDIGTTIDSSNTGGPTLFLYDRYPGGIGFAEKIYEMMEEVVSACWMVVSECKCEEGCPSCVGAPQPPNLGDEGTRETIPDKEAALVLLHALLEKAPYTPKVPRPADRPVAVLAGTDGAPAATVVSIPVKPLPTNVEAKIRRKVRSFGR